MVEQLIVCLDTPCMCSCSCLCMPACIHSLFFCLVTGKRDQHGQWTDRLQPPTPACSEDRVYSTGNARSCLTHSCVHSLIFLVTLRKLFDASTSVV